jgi:hypothetical protein
MFKVWHKSKMFSHIQNIQTLRMDSLNVFFKRPFSYQMCTIPFENYFYNSFEHIWFKSVFDLENYGL